MRAPANRIQSRITPAIVESIMELPEGSVQAVAWLVLQAEADGVTIAEIATNLKVEVEQIQQLKESTTGKEGEDCEQVWLKGIVAIRTSQQLNTQTIAQGWDALEAMALENLTATMQEMKTNGDPDKMLQIATAANKAQRRFRGEGNGMTHRGPAIAQPQQSGEGLSLELNAGNVGSIRLQLSPRIQTQLANPDRVIEGVANNAADGRKLTDSLRMLRLNETRKLVESDEQTKADSAEPAKYKFDFSKLPGALDD